MDLARGCPGSDRSSWGPDDIYDVACPRCGTPVEFFKDDAHRRCPSCGAFLANPKREPGCTDWRTAADKCSPGRGLLIAPDDTPDAETGSSDRGGT